MSQGGLIVGRAGSGSRVSVNNARVSITSDGCFAFGFEYDQKNPTIVVAEFSDGRRETRSLAPVARNYEIQSIGGLPEEFVEPTPEEAARIQRENKLVAESRKRDTPGMGFAEPFDWPVPGIISSLFGSQRILNGVPSTPHLGIDIAAPEGTPIRAPAGGTVVLSEPDFFLTGGTTVLDHGHGVFTAYIHQSALKVSVGQAIKRGSLIGLVGMKGRATGPHLHWGLNWFQMRLDPSLSTRTSVPARA